MAGERIPPEIREALDRIKRNLPAGATDRDAARWAVLAASDMTDGAILVTAEELQVLIEAGVCDVVSKMTGLAIRAKRTEDGRSAFEVETGSTVH